MKSVLMRPGFGQHGKVAAALSAISRLGDAGDFVILQNHFVILQAALVGLHGAPVRWQDIHVKLHSNDATSPDIFVTWKILPVKSPNQPARWQNFPAILRVGAVISRKGRVISRNAHESTQNGFGKKVGMADAQHTLATVARQRTVKPMKTLQL